MNTAILLGILGRVVFGLLAKGMYGLELIVTITVALGLATASVKVKNLMSIMDFRIFWRPIMGVGIRAGSLLSAVILLSRCFLLNWRNSNFEEKSAFETTDVVEPLEETHPAQASRTDFKQYPLNL